MHATYWRRQNDLSLHLRLPAGGAAGGGGLPAGPAHQHTLRADRSHQAENVREAHQLIIYEISPN